MSAQPENRQPRRVNDITAPVRPASEVRKSPRNRAWPRRGSPLSFAVVIAASLLILILGATGLIWHLHAAQSGVSAVQAVEKEVGRHYLLPTDEQPALVTVEDETKVTSPFLKQAKNGDKILIYAKAKVVIIYRPSIDRIVAVGPVFIDTSKNAAAQ